MSLTVKSKSAKERGVVQKTKIIKQVWKTTNFQQIFKNQIAKFYWSRPVHSKLVQCPDKFDRSKLSLYSCGFGRRLQMMHKRRNPISLLDSKTSGNSSWSALLQTKWKFDSLIVYISFRWILYLLSFKYWFLYWKTFALPNLEFDIYRTTALYRSKTIVKIVSAVKGC